MKNDKTNIAYLEHYLCNSQNIEAITSHNNLNTRGEQAFYTKYTGK